MKLKMDENPRDPKYLKICFVCSEEAKPGKEHLKNYGGVVCFGCRAFWRRSHQVTKNPVLHCKRNGNCELTIESRRHCKKCRYQRCLLAGMRPEAVLDPQQKRIHFRKYYIKQERLSKAKKRKSQLKEVEKAPKSKENAKPSPKPRNKIVNIEPRTPERRDFDVDDTFMNDLHRNVDVCHKDNNPVGFNAWENSFHPSSFSSPNFQSCSYDSSNGNMMSCSLPTQEYGQPRVPLPDLDDIHTEALFFWNSMEDL